MSLKVKRNYLEIYSIDDLIEAKIAPKKFTIDLIDPPNFQLNKFFYKCIGKNHRWTDRLSWNDNQWINYTTNKSLKTYILKNFGEKFYKHFLNCSKKHIKSKNLSKNGDLYTVSKKGRFLTDGIAAELFLIKLK